MSQVTRSGTSVFVVVDTDGVPLRADIFCSSSWHGAERKRKAMKPAGLVVEYVPAAHLSHLEKAAELLRDSLKRGMPANAELAERIKLWLSADEAERSKP